MTTPPVRVERRVTQRFPYLLPLSLRQVSPSVEGQGFTQDVSSRGVFFFTDVPLQEGAEIEVTLRMPSEITLGESMRVRCRGHILRVVNKVVKPVAPFQVSNPLPVETPQPETKIEQTKIGETKIVETKIVETKIVGTKIGVAVRLECYEYLSDMAESSASFARVSALHSQPEPVR
jgi:hypothetical protein